MWIHYLKHSCRPNTPLVEVQNKEQKGERARGTESSEIKLRLLTEKRERENFFPPCQSFVVFTTVYWVLWPVATLFGWLWQAKFPLSLSPQIEHAYLCKFSFLAFRSGFCVCSAFNVTRNDQVSFEFVEMRPKTHLFNCDKKKARKKCKVMQIRKTGTARYFANSVSGSAVSW